MVFPVIGGDGKPTGYDISNSVRVGFGHELTKTFTGVSAERKKHTVSCWAKRGNLGDENHLIYAIAGSNSTYIRFNGDDTLRFRFYDGGADQAELVTNRLFRDPSAWYHIVLVYDSTQGTASNRVKIYVNGVQETSFSTEDYPDQNEESIIGNSATHKILGQSSAGDFYVSEWYYIGNQALSPSDFGETNSNGVWVPKEFTGSFGSTNDTYLQFKQTGTSANSSGIGADTSGEDNHWGVTNLTSVDVTTDTPTNNFATLNPLNVLNGTLSEGNTQFVRAASGTANSVSTICPSNGKWYMEFQNSAAQNSAIGVVNVDAQAAGTNIYPYTYAAAILLETNLIATILYDEVASDGETQRSTASGAGTTKIGMAVDLDNQDIYISTNGQWWGGSSFNQGTGPGTALITDLPTTGFAAGFYINGTIINACYYNFGNPGGADSISSGNADANGYGNFEYAVPSGYYSLCTKNLAEYG